MPIELYSLTNIAILAGIGFVAGVLGGLLGIGGSIIIIPLLTIAYGNPYQHLYQAAAMIGNVAIAIPAALRHRKAQAMVPKVLKWMLPAAIVTVLIGSFFSNFVPGVVLGRILAAFMIYVAAANVMKLMPKAKEESLHDARVTRTRSLTVGGALGSFAGLLGIGGGAIATPLQQTLLKLPLKNCIANSTAIICLSSAVGAAYKNATLASVAGHGYHWYDGLLLAACFIPTAIIGGRLGAALTHRLPIRQIRVAFILLMVAAAWKMAAIPT